MRVTLYRARVSPSSPGSQIWTAASQMNLPTSVYPFTSNRSGPKIFLPSPAGCSPPRFTDCKPHGRADVEFFDIDGWSGLVLVTLTVPSQTLSIANLSSPDD